MDGMYTFRGKNYNSYMIICSVFFTDTIGRRFYRGLLGMEVNKHGNASEVGYHKPDTVVVLYHHHLYTVKVSIQYFI